MITPGFTWPTRDEYDLAMSKWQQTVHDDDIRRGILAQDNLGILHYGGANLYACMYRVGDWMVRCFCSQGTSVPPSDIHRRYISIASFCLDNLSHASSLIPLTFIENGITIGLRTFPIIKMPFINAPSLGFYIATHYQERATMEQLSVAWLCMIHELETIWMAHGDLDLTNVIVGHSGSTMILKLIDYDNVWIPILDGKQQTEYGHEHFQHPAFLPPNSRPYNAQMDRFSALVIYISLKVLSSHPELYREWGADDTHRLLLSAADFANVDNDRSRVMQLRRMNDANINPYLDELIISLRNKSMPRSLDDIARDLLNEERPPIFLWQQKVYTKSLFSDGSQPLQTTYRPPLEDADT